jgi:primase-polymerase (primpol)-like protein
MYLYPFKIFALSKNKRLINIDEPHRTVGIYDVMKYNYNDAKDLSECGVENCKVSILLGNIFKDVNLICLDLDDCFDESGNLTPDTADLLSEFDSKEWEVSSSGTGIHVYILTRKNFETFIVKEMIGCKSFECYTNKRHIVTTTFDFKNTNLDIGKHDEYLEAICSEAKRLREKSEQVVMIKTVFNGTEIKNEQDLNSAIYGRKAVDSIYTLRGLCLKDDVLKEVIDMNPESVDQSAHDAKLIRKLMYYCLSFDAAYNMAKKTNYYQMKDEKHKKKFNNPTYIERTRRFIENGGG